MQINKKYVILVLVVVIVIGSLIMLNKKSDTEGTTPDESAEIQNIDGTTSTGQTTSGTPKTNVTKPTGTTASKTSGRLVFTITDDAVSLETLQSITMVINKITVQSPQQGMVTVLNTPKQFDLLDLYRSDKHQLLADLNITAGTYNQVNISVGKITIVQKGGVNSVEAKLPSGELRFNSKIVVEKGKTSGVSFDFISTKALHKTVDGTYMFFPVVKISAEHDLSNVQTLGGNVELIGGLTDFDQTWGMDENGVLKNGFNFNGLSKIEFVGKTIRVMPIEERAGDITVNAETAIGTAVSNGYITSATSIQTVEKSGQKDRVWQIIGVKDSSTVKVFISISTGTVISVE